MTDFTDSNNPSEGDNTSAEPNDVESASTKSPIAGGAVTAADDSDHVAEEPSDAADDATGGWPSVDVPGEWPTDTSAEADSTIDEAEDPEDPNNPEVADSSDDDLVSGDAAAETTELFDEPADTNDADTDDSSGSESIGGTSGSDTSGGAGGLGGVGGGGPSAGPGPGAGPGPAPGPPPYQNPRWPLTRDPHSSLGGVASGIAHYFGLDVALVRIAFALLIFVSGGTVILLYLLAWLIIPRATYWPPPRPSRSLGAMNNKNLGIMLAVLGVIAFAAFGSNNVGNIVVPLALVGGGVWLLTQRSENPPQPGADIGQAGAPLAGAQFPPPPPGQGPSAYAQTAYVTAPPPVAPVAVERRKRRGLGVVLGILLTGLVLLVVLVIGGALLLLLGTGVDVNADFEGISATYDPATIDEVPQNLDLGSGELVIDLSDIDSDDFIQNGEPTPIDIEMFAGEIEIVVPEDVEVDIDVSVTGGDINVFGDRRSGLGVDIEQSSSNPDLDLDIDLTFGEVRVSRP